MEPEGCIGDLIEISILGDLPSFFTFDEVAKVVRLDGGTVDEGLITFEFVVVAKSGGFVNEEYAFSVETVLENEAPQFDETLEDIVIFLDQKQESEIIWRLPPISDKEGDEIKQLLVSLGEAAQWLTYDPETQQFKIEDLTKAALGEYPVSIKITDDQD